MRRRMPDTSDIAVGGTGPGGGSAGAGRLRALVPGCPLVVVVGPAGAGRDAALTALAGPAGRGTMIDLGALWMTVDPPGDRPRTVRLNGAPVGRDAAASIRTAPIAAAIGTVARPPAVVLVDTFAGLAAALGEEAAATTVAALVLPGRTVVVVLDGADGSDRLAALLDAVRGAGRDGMAAIVEGADVRFVGTPNAASPPGPPPPAWPGLPSPRLPVPGRPGLPGDPLGRRVQVAVTDSAEAPVQQSLTPGGYYLIRFAIRAAEPHVPSGVPVSGVPVSGVPVSDVPVSGVPALDVPAPAEPGPAAVRLEVAVITDAVAVPPGPHSVHLPLAGDAWICACPPDAPHACPPDERSTALALPFMAPRRPGTYRVHLAVRRDGAVVHQTRVELPVGPGSNQPGPQATVTFSADEG